ncbi:DUF2062 domain-containing protein [Fulvivirgaceae bacterium PWU5]|uniref:DUF2062 domain-containing protein n=1 Tax=Dawidia cretensis TaxID=2782350 RepID=A0AAP2E171_9BACT|nr:DUF2062 domain-containing protein [Dawidia cretensis]MBT1711121.1 DUF2062 domain-containing protein [Dawidia cretensis]
MAVGIFMGIVPLWGFQLILAIALAFALRLNKALVILTANISIPPMIPLILFLSHLTGRIWMGDRAQYIRFSRDIDFAQLHNSFLQYVLGATTLAVAAALVSGLLTFVLVKVLRMRRSEK